MFPCAKAKLGVNELFYSRHLMFHWWQNTKLLASSVWFENLERNRNTDLFSPPYFVPPLYYENLFSVSVYCISTIPVPILWVPHQDLLSASVPLLNLSWFLLYLSSAQLLKAHSISFLSLTHPSALINTDTALSLNIDPLPCCFSLKGRKRKEGNEADQCSCSEFSQGLDYARAATTKMYSS